GLRRTFRTQYDGHGLHRDMSGSAPGLFICRGCRLHVMLRPACWLPAVQLALRHGLLTPRSSAKLSPVGWGLLLGAPALTEAGLAPAGRAHGETTPPLLPRARSSASSRRTMPAMIAIRRPARMVSVPPRF